MLRKNYDQITIRIKKIYYLCEISLILARFLLFIDFCPKYIFRSLSVL